MPPVDGPHPAMFVPPHYAAPDLRALIRKYPFATLVTMSDRAFYATSTPLVFETDKSDEPMLIGHIALRNDHAQALDAPQPALAVFSGPNAYISPRWYVDKPQVPTWNYLSVQVRGTLEPLTDDAATLAVLRRTIQVMEAGATAPWTMQDAPAGMVDTLLPRIKAFRLKIEQIEGAAKLSQAHPPADRLRVIRGLLSESDPDGIEVAHIMAGQFRES